MAGSRRNLYCRGSSVLQYSGVQGFKTVLQYSLLSSSVLQYTALYCGWKGYKRPGCIAIQPGVSWHETRLLVSQDRQLCRDTALGWGAGRAGRRRKGVGARRRQAPVGSGMAWARKGARRAGGRAARRRARGAQAGARRASGRAAQAGARQGHTAGRAAHTARARHRRWARRLAKGCALGALSLFLAQLDSVFFLSHIFGHCS